MISKTTLAIAVASLGVLSWGAASAATLLPNTGTTLALMPLALDTQAFDAGTANGGAYYYTFKTLGDYKVKFTDTGSLNAATVEDDFTVSKGSVPGVGVPVATSSFFTLSSGVTARLGAGTYTLYIPTTTVGQALTGTVSVAAVPEPAAWSMMILGFACIGGAVRRRSQRASLAAA